MNYATQQINRERKTFEKGTFDGSGQKFDFDNATEWIIPKNESKVLENSLGISFEGKPLCAIYREVRELEDKLERVDYSRADVFFYQDLMEKVDAIKRFKKIFGFDELGKGGGPRFDHRSEGFILEKGKIFAKNKLRLIELFLEIRISGKTIEQAERILAEEEFKIARILDDLIERMAEKSLCLAHMRKYNRIRDAKKILLGSE